MKLSKLKTCLMAVAFGGVVCAHAADFSKKSDSEIIKLSGIVKVEEFVDYELEVAKRLKSKAQKEAKEFKEKLKAQYEKATENLSVKQYREYREATHEAMKKYIDKLSEKELKESGLPYKHFKGEKGKDKKACDCKMK